MPLLFFLCILWISFLYIHKIFCVFKYMYVCVNFVGFLTIKYVKRYVRRLLKFIMILLHVAVVRFSDT